MAEFQLDERMRLVIELAFTVERGDLFMHHQQDTEARRFGLRGAEIDAARCGRSFDRRTAVALALALATASEDLRTHRARAEKAGIPADVSREIERYARRLQSALETVSPDSD